MANGYMDAQHQKWLEDNLSSYIGSSNRVKYMRLGAAFEEKFGRILDNAELYEWLKAKEMPVHHLPKGRRTRKSGWPKGKPRGHRKEKEVPVPKFVDSFRARIFDGEIYVPFEEVKKIFENEKRGVYDEHA